MLLEKWNGKMWKKNGIKKTMKPFFFLWADELLACDFIVRMGVVVQKPSEGVTGKRPVEGGKLQ